MEVRNTKQAIIEASLSLFSKQGFEATSISQIAEAVGIKKASLYSHFSSKQAILDSLIDMVLTEYDKHSLFVRADWKKDASLSPHTADEAVLMIQEQMRFIIHNPTISKARKMLIIEQFQNPKLAQLQNKQNYTDVLNYFRDLIKQMIKQNVLKDEDPEVMAAQFCLPISVWINLCDRQQENEQEVMQLVEKHIKQFFKLYQP